MSRSAWALAEARVSGACTQGAGEEDRLGATERLARYLRHAAAATTIAITVLAACVLAIAAEPASALAASAGEAHGIRSSTSRVDVARPASLVVGSGYSNLRDAARVSALQRRLARDGDAPGPIDGLYGPITEQAVSSFQRTHGLSVDGIAGPRTMATLTTRTPVLYPGAGYQRGTGSPAVRTVQRRLAAAGDAPGPIDGLYGPLTTQAVERFQRAHGLGVDGIVGAETWRALRPPSTPGVSSRPGRRPVPHSLTVPKSGPAPATPRHPARAPSLPVTFVLLALAALGVLTGAASYRRTLSRIRRQQPLGAATVPHAAEKPSASRGG